MDFDYDLASHYDFEGNILKEAIRQTFTNRGTDCTMRSLNLIASMNKVSNNLKLLLNSVIDSKRFTLKDGRKALEYYASASYLGKVLIKVED